MEAIINDKSSKRRNFKVWVKDEWAETRALLKAVPALPLVFFIMSIIMMNILASKTLIDENWIYLDCGNLISWMSFLSMDMVVKRFGPKASVKLSILAVLINLLACSIFAIAAIIPDVDPEYIWGLNDYGTLDSWWIVGASSAAFLISGVVNAFTNWSIRKTFKKNPDGWGAYIASSYGSTVIGQFVDNLVFAALWNLPATLLGRIGGNITILSFFMYALVAAIVELICQIVFSPIGYKIATSWQKQGIGQEYLDLVEQHTRHKD